MVPVSGPAATPPSHHHVAQSYCNALSHQWPRRYYIVIGTSTALETLGAQAAGARDQSALAVWGMAAGVVMTLLGIGMAVSAA